MTAPTHITVRVPLRIRRRPGRKTVVTPVVDGLPMHTATRADPVLLKALARAFRYQRMLDDGRYASFSEMATAEKLDRGYLGRLPQLTLLAPDIVEAIVEGRQAEGVTLPGIIENVPLAWDEQREALAHSMPMHDGESSWRACRRSAHSAMACLCQSSAAQRPQSRSPPKEWFSQATPNG